MILGTPNLNRTKAVNPIELKKNKKIHSLASVPNLV
jgi:hypothetical protein